MIIDCRFQVLNLPGGENESMITLFLSFDIKHPSFLLNLFFFSFCLKLAFSFYLSYIFFTSLISFTWLSSMTWREKACLSNVEHSIESSIYIQLQGEGSYICSKKSLTIKTTTKKHLYMVAKTIYDYYLNVVVASLQKKQWKIPE